MLNNNLRTELAKHGNPVILLSQILNVSIRMAQAKLDKCSNIELTDGDMIKIKEFFPKLSAGQMAFDEDE